MEKKYSERRKHTRHPAIDEAFVLSPKVTGRILDISEGGMAIKTFDQNELFLREWKTAFYCKDTGTNVRGVPLKIVREETVEFSKFGTATQTIGVAFDKLTIFQKEQINRYISMCKFISFQDNHQLV